MRKRRKMKKRKEFIALVGEFLATAFIFGSGLFTMALMVCIAG